jgi:hypothetical protein
MLQADSTRGARNALCTTAMKKHIHSSDDHLIQYRGKYLLHSRGQVLIDDEHCQAQGWETSRPSRASGGSDRSRQVDASVTEVLGQHCNSWSGRIPPCPRLRNPARSDPPKNF